MESFGKGKQNAFDITNARIKHNIYNIFLFIKTFLRKNYVLLKLFDLYTLYRNTCEREVSAVSINIIFYCSINRKSIQYNEILYKFYIENRK